MNAKETLIAFMKEMNCWENNYRDAFMADHGIDKEPYKNALNNIFSKWCTIKERKQGRQIAMQVSFPPDYDPDIDELNEDVLTKNKATFIVQKHAGFKHKYRYTLAFRNDEWRVDKRERFSPDENKWVKDIL